MAIIKIMLELTFDASQSGWFVLTSYSSPLAGVLVFLFVVYVTEILLYLFSASEKFWLDPVLRK